MLMQIPRSARAVLRLPALMAFAVATADAQVSEPLTAQQAMTFTAVVGSWQSSLWALDQIFPGSSTTNAFAWTMQYTETGAAVRGSGQLGGLSLALAGAGALSGSYGSDLVWTDAWSGSIGADAVAIVNQVLFAWDPSRAAYATASRTQGGKVGDGDSEWTLVGSYDLFDLSSGIAQPGWSNGVAVLATRGATGPTMQKAQLSGTRRIIDMLVHRVRRNLGLDPPGCPTWVIPSVKGSFDISASGCGSNSSGFVDDGSGGGSTYLTPEPGTRPLVGAALVVLVLISARRRRSIMTRCGASPTCEPAAAKRQAPAWRERHPRRARRGDHG